MDACRLDIRSSSSNDLVSIVMFLFTEVYHIMSQLQDTFRTRNSMIKLYSFIN